MKIAIAKSVISAILAYINCRESQEREETVTRSRPRTKYNSTYDLNQNLASTTGFLLVKESILLYFNS
jgi:hypothetical protein